MREVDVVGRVIRGSIQGYVIFDFDLVKRMNSAMISRTSSVSFGERVADEEVLGEALRVASDRQEYSRFKVSWLKDRSK